LEKPPFTPICYSNPQLADSLDFHEKRQAIFEPNPKIKKIKIQSSSEKENTSPQKVGTFQSLSVLSTVEGADDRTLKHININ